jgi:hypothetical protein
MKEERKYYAEIPSIHSDEKIKISLVQSIQILLYIAASREKFQ